MYIDRPFSRSMPASAEVHGVTSTGNQLGQSLALLKMTKL